MIAEFRCQARSASSGYRRSPSSRSSELADRPIGAIQSHYNRASAHEVVDYCTRERIVFVPYFPLGGSHPDLADIAEERDASPSNRFNWLLHRSPMVLPIPGSLSIDHVRQNLPRST